MKYTEKKEIEKIKIVFKTFLVSKGLNLKSFCKANGLDYIQTYQKINVGFVDHDFITSLIKKVDINCNLVKFRENFQILK